MLVWGAWGAGFEEVPLEDSDSEDDVDDLDANSKAEVRRQVP